MFDACYNTRKPRPAHYRKKKKKRIVRITEVQSLAEMPFYCLMSNALKVKVVWESTIF